MRVERNEIEESGEYDLERLFVRLNFAIDDRRKSCAAGFDGQMVKPVDLDALMKWLAELRPTPE